MGELIVMIDMPLLALFAFCLIVCRYVFMLLLELLNASWMLVAMKGFVGDLSTWFSGVMMLAWDLQKSWACTSFDMRLKFRLLRNLAYFAVNYFD